MDIGNITAELRSKAGISQQELADRLHVSRDLVSKWENGTRRPDYNMIEQIADVFCVPVETIVDTNDLIFGELAECIPQDTDLSGEALTELLNAFLHNINKKDADIFIMRYYFLKANSQIAAYYGMGENHVRSRLSKVRRKLKSFLKEELQ